jgi:hypothetical protein
MVINVDLSRLIDRVGYTPVNFFSPPPLSPREGDHEVTRGGNPRKRAAKHFTLQLDQQTCLRVHVAGARRKTSELNNRHLQYNTFYHLSFHSARLIDAKN